MRPVRLCILSALAALAACGRAPDAPATRGNDDPAVAAALADPIASDPDLAAQNRANAAASFPSIDGSVPSLDFGSEAIARARADAVALVGGAAHLRSAPPVVAAFDVLPAGTFAAVAAGAPACAGKVTRSAAWAAGMPSAFPVYPRAAVQQAAGSDADGCRLRLVRFETPVPLREVLDFYFSRASAEGFATQHVLQGRDDVLQAAKRGASFSVYARQLPSGATQADLVSEGII